MANNVPIHPYYSILTVRRKKEARVAGEDEARGVSYVYARFLYIAFSINVISNDFFWANFLHIYPS